MNNKQTCVMRTSLTDGTRYSVPECFSLCSFINPVVSFCELTSSVKISLLEMSGVYRFYLLVVVKRYVAGFDYISLVV